MTDIVDVVVEIPYMSNVKYEIEDNKLCVDRVLPVPMMYPEIMVIPETLAGDDPIDVLIINSTAFTYVSCKM